MAKRIRQGSTSEEMIVQLRSGLLFTWCEPRLLIFLSVEAPGRQDMLGSVEPKLQILQIYDPQNTIVKRVRLVFQWG